MKHPTIRFGEYAILTHHWNGIHWDFLVEAEERPAKSLRTWAIDKPIVAGSDLPARSLPDHRRLYLDYEGPIGGNRGRVERWDRGTAFVQVWTDDRVRLHVQGNQLVGVVELRVVAGINPTDPRRWLFRFGKLS